MFKGKSLLLVFVLSLAAILAACNGDKAGSTGKTDEAWKPSKPIEFIAPAGAGGGWDTTARTVAKVMQEQKIVDQRMAVVNKPGGGGAIGWAYINEKDTDDHFAIPDITTNHVCTFERSI